MVTNKSNNSRLLSMTLFGYAIDQNSRTSMAMWVGAV